MHEFGIARGLLEVVLERANAAHADSVESVKLEMGILSGVEEEALRFAFDALSAGTIAGDTKLMIQRVPIRCHCGTCDQTFECSPLDYACPDCGAISAELLNGREMNIISMEVNDHV